MEKARQALIRQMQNLTKVKVNDGVKLAYLTAEQVDQIDGLDLRALTEFKRSSQGVVEVKFMDRYRMLGELLTLTEEKEGSPVEELLEALARGE